MIKIPYLFAVMCKSCLLRPMKLEVAIRWNWKVPDTHLQVSTIRTNWILILLFLIATMVLPIHFYDIWHKAKSTIKEVNKASKEKVAVF